MKHSTQNKAFTLIELIFVIVIIGILAAIAVPKLQETRDVEHAKKVQHVNDKLEAGMPNRSTSTWE